MKNIVFGVCLFLFAFDVFAEAPDASQLVTPPAADQTIPSKPPAASTTDSLENNTMPQKELKAKRDVARRKHKRRKHRRGRRRRH